MEDAKNLDPARVASGEQRLPGIANNMLTGLAETAVRAALWRHRNGLPLPEIQLHGYGNSRLHGVRTGQARANAAAARVEAEVVRLLDELQKDVPPALRLTADKIRTRPISHGREVPPGSRDPWGLSSKVVWLICFDLGLWCVGMSWLMSSGVWSSRCCRRQGRM
ncbi:hypothetical protein, partial [Lentzea flava]|uniref:hypothetical protein n=2 Tax=Lentzea flava TaxID=103732 RepID=UPI0020A54F61